LASICPGMEMKDYYAANTKQYAEQAFPMSQFIHSVGERADHDK